MTNLQTHPLLFPDFACPFRRTSHVSDRIRLVLPQNPGRKERLRRPRSRLAIAGRTANLRRLFSADRSHHCPEPCAEVRCRAYCPERSEAPSSEVPSPAPARDTDRFPAAVAVTAEDLEW